MSRVLCPRCHVWLEAERETVLMAGPGGAPIAAIGVVVGLPEHDCRPGRGESEVESPGALAAPPKGASA